MSQPAMMASGVALLFFGTAIASFIFCIALAAVVVVIVAYYWWVAPIVAHRRLKRSGFTGPAPSFPFGNLGEMTRKKSEKMEVGLKAASLISHDIHGVVSPFYARWQQDYGKVFVYWLGTEPFLYVADPEFLRKMSSDVLGKSWGKPTLFKRDRDSMFGRGLNMVEGDEWAVHRHIISPAFSPANLKGMTSMMVEIATKSMDRLDSMIKSGGNEIDMESEMIELSGEIIARTGFGLADEKARKLMEKLKALQVTLYSSHFIGVPFGQFMTPKRTIMSRQLGREIDHLFSDIIKNRKHKMIDGHPQTDFLGLLLASNNGKTGLSMRNLIDECKTFFFGGHETTGIALSWALLCLAMYTKWQDELRDEIKEVIGENEIDYSILRGLKKMNLVIKEVLRLYASSPNVQRQTRQDITVNGQTIPKDTNIWIDIVSMHHDPDLWGPDVFEFRPERFIDDPLYGGCKHKMGYIPFGFGGRMCVGRSLTDAEYKIALAAILPRFSFSVAPGYRHRPTTLLTLKPANGLPLIVHSLQIS